MPRSLTGAIRNRVASLFLPPVVRAVSAESLTYLGKDALADLFEAVQRLEDSRDGILIEAGCALGGSGIVMATAKSKVRPLYIFDVFGMIPPPSGEDGADVHERYRVIQSGQSKGLGDGTYYGYQTDLLGVVRQSFERHGLPPDANSIHLVRGLFEDTLQIDQPVALAHVDCDWYQSVMVCLQRIEPRLIPGGRIVVDDYDAWSGCRKAVDEYFRDKQDHYQFVRKARLHIVRR